METFKIVADSSSDIIELSKASFSAVPLKIITAGKEFVDDESLDVGEMVEYLSSYKGRSSSSCPNPQDWISAFGESENVFCITITSSLSGCHNAALIAKKIYEENNPGRRVFVLDSLSTGPEMGLVIELAEKLYLEGKSFENICASCEEYSKGTKLFFLLKSMKNLANNGRVSHLVAKAAGLLGIRALGQASDKGELEMLDKCRGRENTLKTVFSRMKEKGYSGGKVRLSHCMNEEDAGLLESYILSEFPGADISIYPTRALCSFYAENGGLLVGFETKI